jgi:hypothetical protein
MQDEDRELAGDCWQALNILRHPSQGEPETPPWLAAAASELHPVALPNVVLMYP